MRREERGFWVLGAVALRGFASKDYRFLTALRCVRNGKGVVSSECLLGRFTLTLALSQNERQDRSPRSGGHIVEGLAYNSLD